MADKSAAEQPAQPNDSKLENEIWWTLRRLGILMQCWTTPVNASTVNTFTRDDGASARALALILIVALAFAVRGESTATAGTTFTALAGGLAIIMSFVLNVASRTLGVTASERMIISAYVSTIFVMFLFLLIDISFRWDPWGLETFANESKFAEFVGKHVAQPLVVVGLAILVIFAALLIKAWFLDKRRPNGLALVHAAALTIGSGAIVLFVSLLSSGGFVVVQNCLTNPTWSCLKGISG